jgi:site-specific DNA recombinase
VKAAIYARVSTDDQAQRQKPIDDQLAACRALCAREGWTIHAEYTDPGISGTIWPRPGIAHAVADAEKGLVQRIVSWDASRIARDDDLAGFIAWRIRGAGCALVTVQGGGSDLERGITRVIDAHYVRTVRASVKRGLWSTAAVHP